MERLVICIILAFFIIMPLIIICFNINLGDPNADDSHIRDPWTKEIVDDYYDK